MSIKTPAPSEGPPDDDPWTGGVIPIKTIPAASDAPAKPAALLWGPEIDFGVDAPSPSPFAGIIKGLDGFTQTVIKSGEAFSKFEASLQSVHGPVSPNSPVKTGGPEIKVEIEKDFASHALIYAVYIGGFYATVKVPMKMIEDKGTQYVAHYAAAQIAGAVYQQIMAAMNVTTPD